MPTNKDRALQTLQNLPPTPGRQVKYLKAELEKKDNENETLKTSIASLTKALEDLRVVSDKVELPHFSQNNAADNKKGKKKDANAPKRALSSYIFFCQEKRQEITQKHPEKTLTEISKILGEEWGKVKSKSNGTKKYDKLAADDKIRYEKENEVYKKMMKENETENEALQMLYDRKRQDLAIEFLDAHMQAQNVTAEKSKKMKDPDAPKRAMSNFMYFSQDKREAIKKKNPNKSTTEISKILGEEWGKAKNRKNGIKKYEKLASEDMARYEKQKVVYGELKATRLESAEQERMVQLQKDKEEAMKLFEQTQTDMKAQNEKLQSGEGTTQTQHPVKKTKQAKDPDAPKRGKSNYLFFCQENRHEIMQKNPNKSPTEITKILGEEWNIIKSKNATKKYDDMAADDKVRYENQKKIYEANKGTQQTTAS